MCKLVEDYAREYAREYAKEYAEKQKEAQTIAVALKLIEGRVLDDEQIADATGLPVEKVRNLRTQKM